MNEQEPFRIAPAQTLREIRWGAFGVSIHTDDGSVFAILGGKGETAIIAIMNRHILAALNEIEELRKGQHVDR